MKISYDARADVLTLVFRDTGIITRDSGDGINAEYDDQGQLSCVRIHQAMTTAAGREVFRQIVVEGIGPFVEKSPLIIVPRLFEETEMSDGPSS